MPGVYLSYPFCGQKCTYCNFASGVLPAELERDYMDALVAEAAAHPWEWEPETLYLGGGTPGRMDRATLERVLAAIPGRPWKEATIEAAPGGITPEQAHAWVDVGITRVSLGVQSFNEAELRVTGRRHKAEIVEREAGILRAAGLEEVNIDLIVGLPRQTIETFAESLAWVDRIAPPHVSVYMLEVDEESRLGAEILRHGRRYGAAETPSEEMTVEMYERAVDELGRMGIRRYEISNFARPGHVSLHNLKYWRLEPYVGFGADAHGFDGRTRRRNVESAGEYVERFRRGLAPGIEEIEAQPAQERFYVGLRLTDGMRPRPQDWVEWEAPIRRFVDSGLLERQGDTLRLTRRGVLLSNEVFQEFVAR